VSNITGHAARAVTEVEAGKKFLKGMTQTEIDWLAFVPDEIRSRVLHAIQPPAHEVMGFTRDAERLTVEQAKARYLEDLKSRIDLPEDGIMPATYHNSQRMLRLALDLKTDESGENQGTRNGSKSHRRIGSASVVHAFGPPAISSFVRRQASNRSVSFRCPIT
jgi:hypothetical protein